MRAGLRRGVAGRRGDHGQPLWHHPAARGSPRPAHLLPRPRPHRRRRGAAGGDAGARRRSEHLRARGAHGLPPDVRRGVVRASPHHDDGDADRPQRQPEHLVYRRLAPPEDPARRGAGRAGQHRQPPDQLLGAGALATQLRRAGRHGERGRLCTGDGGRPGGDALPRDTPGGVQPRGVRLRDARAGDAAAIRASGCLRGRGRRGDRLRARRPRRRARDAHPVRRGARHHPPAGSRRCAGPRARG